MKSMSIIQKTGLLLVLSLIALSGFAQTVHTEGKDTTESQATKYNRFFLEAMMQREKGDGAAAFELFRHCIDIDSTRAEAYFFLSQCYDDLKENKLSLSYMEKATKLEPTNQTFIETLAGAYINNRQYADAIKAIEKVLEMDKERDDLIQILIQLHEEEGELEKAISCIHRLEELNGKSERLSYFKANLYIRSGNKDAAIEEMKQLAERYPNDLYYRCFYGDMLANCNELDKSMAIFQEILQEDSVNERAMLSMRNVYTLQDKQELADSITKHLLFMPSTSDEIRCSMMVDMIRKYESDSDSCQIPLLIQQVLPLCPENTEMYLICATYYQRYEFPRDTIKPLIQEALRLSPDNTAARLNLIAYAWEENNMHEVINLCHEARQYVPDNISFYYYEGVAYYRDNEDDKALATLQLGADLINEETDRTTVANIYEIMGELYHKKGMFAQSYAAYDSCLQIKPEDSSCLNNYAYYLCIDGSDNLDKAEKMSRKSIELDAKNPNNLDTYAWILFSQGKYAEARIYIEQALQCDSTESSLLFEHAGDIFFKCNLVEQAVEYWKKSAEKADSADNKTLFRKIKKRKYYAK